MEGKPLNKSHFDLLNIGINTHDQIDAYIAASESKVVTAQVRNQTGATLTKGTVVYISGASGNKPLVLKAQANSEVTSSKTFGIIKADIPDNQNGEAVFVGSLAGLDTLVYPEGTALWLSPSVAGGYTSTKPVAPNHAVFLGVVTRQHQNQGSIEVRIVNGYELEELHNVLITNPQNGQVIAYDSADQLYKNTTLEIEDISNLQTSLDSKQNTLVSGTNIKTVGTQSVLGGGDVTNLTLNGVNIQNASEPATPSSGIEIYGGSLAGRMLLRLKGTYGIATSLQPSFFQNHISMISAGNETDLNVFGNSAISVGTISHPTTTELYGFMANIVTAAIAGAEAGTGNTALPWCIGSLNGGSNGFFYFARLAFPDASYNESGASTGSRVFAGMTTNTITTSVSSDNPIGSRAGFQRCSVNGGRIHANWQFSTKNGTSGLETLVDTGVPFVAQKVYDLYIFAPPLATSLNWRIDNLTDGISNEGNVSTNLPVATNFMRMMAGLETVNAVARNIRLRTIYGEADR